MTTPKTSVEKLRTQNEMVKDLKSALRASQWKWKEIELQAIYLCNLIEHTCGFCILALQKCTVEIPGKCLNCPTEIREECNRIIMKSSDLMNGVLEWIRETQMFLDGLKY